MYPSHALIPFSAPPSPFSLSVDCSLESSELTLQFVLTGDITSLNLPSPSEHPVRIEGLYHHTCMEVFLKRGKKYLEWNFSFSGDWSVFLFDDYRSKSQTQLPLGSELFIVNHISHSSRGATLKVSIPMKKLAFLGTEPTELGVSAILEHPKGIFSYWALDHAESRPDFHHPKSFKLKL
jgi:hypothetical protein